MSLVGDQRLKLVTCTLVWDKLCHSTFTTHGSGASPIAQTKVVSSCGLICTYICWYWCWYWYWYWYDTVSLWFKMFYWFKMSNTLSTSFHRPWVHRTPMAWQVECGRWLAQNRRREKLNEGWKQASLVHQATQMFGAFKIKWMGIDEEPIYNSFIQCILVLNLLNMTR